MKPGPLDYWLVGLACAAFLSTASFQGTALAAPKDPDSLRDSKAGPHEAKADTATLENVRESVRQGHYSEAEISARGLILTVEAGHGAESVEAADVLDALVEALWRGGKSGESETRELAERAVRIREKTQGSDHIDLAKSLTNLGIVLFEAGDYAGARPLQERALAIREKDLGPDHPDVAKSLNELGLVFCQTGDYAKARPLYERALAISEKTLGPDNPAVAINLNNLASVLYEIGDFAGARLLDERALAIREKGLGPDHPDVAASLGNLANLLYETGDYAGARPLYERALAISERSFGPDNAQVARCLNNLAMLLNRTGDYAGARPLLERALAIKEKALGPDHLDVATSLQNLANVLYFTGDYAGAKPLEERALAIREKALGPDHREVAVSLNDLANVLVKLGDYAGSRRLCERALAISEKALGPDHPDVAHSLDNLATVLMDIGDYAGARPLYERALAIEEKAIGPDSPDVAQSLDNLATVLIEFSDYAEAKLLYERALAIMEKTLGPNHPDVAGSLTRLALLKLLTGNHDGAIPDALRGEAIARENLRITARTLSERQAMGFAAERTSGLGVAFSAAVRSGDSALASKVWDAGIRSRALVLDEMAERHRGRPPESDPTIARLDSTLGAVRARLANLVVRGIGDLEPEAYRHLVEGASGEKEEAERALAAASAPFRSEQTRASIGLTEVAASLPKGGALIGFFEYLQQARQPNDSIHLGTDRAVAAPAPPSVSTLSYLTFVLRGDRHESELVDLGPAAPIDSLISAWRDAVVAGVGLESTEGAEVAYRRVGAALRERIWDPVAAHLAGVSSVFIVPDGALNLLDFSSLPLGATDYVVERGPLIHYLSAERDLVLEDAPASPGEGLLVLGGANFDQASPYPPLTMSGRKNPRHSIVDSLVASTYRGPRSECETFARMRFVPLPGSAREADRVASLWKQETKSGNVLELRGEEASESAIKNLAAGRRVLHIATHGFFLDDRCVENLPEVPRGLKAVAPELMENPLLRSGLVLAGANRRGGAKPGGDDGILTAEEVASLDLTAAEWVVLSACDTGLGHVATGEGVLGLRRAFQIAGAKTLIMSLWKVDDQTTQSWMRRLYEARWGRRMGTAEAVRAASMEMLHQRRQRGQSTHPANWAGFIAIGDWR
jgi:CHAT domain-containing protein/tetratricopeptide (TPR) repeat protein